MHWEWKNCPSGWKGMFQGKSGVPTVVLEAIAENRCRFWHFNFGSPGAMISTSWTVLPYSTMPFVVSLRQSILLSMGMHISMHIGLVTEFILAMLVS
jgi:hypothetical protein